MTLNINPLKLPLSRNPEDRLGEIQLRLYQSQLRNCDHPRILLHAPTSSGKTLAYLIRAIETRDLKPRYETTIIVYPTNTLIWDQADALYKLISEKIGKKANLLVESEEIRWEVEEKGAEIDLFVLNGETLGALAEQRHTSEGRAIAEELRKNRERPRIILTNPEILYYMFLYRFARGEEIIKTLFQSGSRNLLIFDEFHLYYGYTLATMTYMLGYMKDLFDQIIFSSATPIDIKSIIHDEYQKIVATPSDVGDTVRHPISLDLCGIRGILGFEDIPMLKDLIGRYYNMCKDFGRAVKVLVILNSVTTCAKVVEELEKDYHGEITAIHGLVPQKSRPRKQSDFKSIVVGTSAVEVGVDFDVSSLIFEAHDSSTFIQRLGRGGRHGSCYSTAFIPELYLGSIRENIKNTMQMNALELNSIIAAAMPRLQSYENFPDSRHALPILFAILLNWVFERPAGGRRLNIGQAFKELERQLKDRSISLPREFEHFRQSLIDMCASKKDLSTVHLARKMSCRSSLDTIPAIFISGNSPQFERLSLHELSKLEFEIVKKEELQQKGVKIPWKMKLNDEFLQVSRLREKQEKVGIRIYNINDNSPYPLTRFSVDARDQNLANKVHEILRNQPAYPLFSRQDWRLAGLYDYSGRYVVVGGDAYLAWFLMENGINTA